MNWKLTKKKIKWSLVSIFLNGAYGCSFPSKKKRVTLRKKGRRKKTITSKIFIVFRAICVVGFGPNKSCHISKRCKS